MAGHMGQVKTKQSITRIGWLTADNIRRVDVFDCVLDAFALEELGQSVLQLRSNVLQDQISRSIVLFLPILLKQNKHKQGK